MRRILQNACLRKANHSVLKTCEPLASSTQRIHVRSTLSFDPRSYRYKLVISLTISGRNWYHPLDFSIVIKIALQVDFIYYWFILYTSTVYYIIYIPRAARMKFQPKFAFKNIGARLIVDHQNRHFHHKLIPPDVCANIIPISIARKVPAKWFCRSQNSV